ncbi:MAG TPA: hypothetical protein VIP11_09900 [Gemmatimonadaceae bacterium]
MAKQRDPSVRRRGTSLTPTRYDTSLPAAAPEATAPTTPLGFLSKHFTSLPKRWQVVAYFVMLFGALMLMTEEPVLSGTLYVRAPGDTVDVPAEGYTVMLADGARYTVNREGRWFFSLSRLQFRNLRVQILTPDRQGILDTVTLCVPLPGERFLVGHTAHALTYKASSRSTDAFPKCGPRGVAHAAEPPATRVPPLAFQIRLLSLQIAGTGHAKSPAELYFVVRSGSQVLSTPSLPTKNRRESWLVMMEGRTVRLNAMFISPENGRPLLLEVWDRESGVLGRETLVARFALPTQRGGPVSLRDIGQTRSVLTAQIN